MSFVNFIDFNTDKNTALSVRTSPIIEFHTFTGIQLLPNNPLPYVQTTNVNEGIELEDWEVFVVDLCTEQETDITDYFTVERVFQDTNGQSQFDWSVKNVPFDFGYNLVYLKVNQLIGETFYSNTFQFTNYKSEKTCRIDYKAKEISTMQSIQVKMFFWQSLKQTEIGSYYETSTRNTVTTVVKSQKYERWTTEFMSNNLMIKIDDAFENKFVYVDLVRCNLFEANEIKEFTAQEDFKENNLKLAFNKSDVYDPLYVAPITSTIPTITLNSVVTNGVSAIYDFAYENFVPTYLVFQRSQDEITWIDATNGVSSPQTIPFNGTGIWFFRIEHPEAISNTIEIDLGDAVVAVDDSAQVVKGGVVDISVLFNDTLVGTTTITGVTTPTNGTAVAINGDTEIRYTHNDTATTFDTFDYTIGNGITSDTATVNVTITTVGQTSKPFDTNSIGHNSGNQACLLALNTTRYHTGPGAFPTPGAFIYTDAALTTIFDGANQWYPINNGRRIKIDNTGLVTDAAFC